MSEGTKIQWCDDTHNFWRGCVKVSPGCKNCYAEISTPVRVARSEGRELWGGTLRDRAKDFDAPLRWIHPRDKKGETNWNGPKIYASVNSLR